jgi:hypothetical protein
LICGDALSRLAGAFPIKTTINADAMRFTSVELQHIVNEEQQYKMIDLSVARADLKESQFQKKDERIQNGNSGVVSMQWERQH